MAPLSQYNPEYGLRSVWSVNVCNNLGNYCSNSSTEDTTTTALHSALTHLDSNTDVKMLFVDFSSAFNTVCPFMLVTQLCELGFIYSTCN